VYAVLVYCLAIATMGYRALVRSATRFPAASVLLGSFGALRSAMRRLTTRHVLLNLDNSFVVLSVVRFGVCWCALRVRCCSFVASDSLLSLDKFVAPVPHAKLFVMLTYYGAQLLIAMSAVTSERPADKKAR
jgi:uncharacterized membrane protein YhhN